ncbi:MAG: DUF4358 domain-containing protein [Lachnospiraceae bacterium]|nr:DUF4358 domain-containing protein [Lachnospiraceae bacterium]
MKKSIAVFLVSLLLGGCFFIGCGAGENKEQAAVDQTLEEIYTQMIDKVEMPTMVRMDEEYITNYFGIDLTAFDEYVFAAAEDALLAENIILVKVKEGQSNEPVVEILEKIIKQKKAELESYLPEQFKIVEKSSVVTKGNYVILIISSKKSELEAQLPDALK